MRVLLIADRDFARRESALLARLEMGLVGEGVRVSLALPDDAALAETRVYTNLLRFRDRASFLSRPARARDLLERLAQGADLDRPVDIVHALGEDTWSFAAALAQHAEALLALEVWAIRLVRRAVELADHSSMLLVPDRAIERALRREEGRGSVRHVPWGVPTEAASTRSEVPSVVLVGSGDDARAARAALEGIALAQGPAPMIFIDADLASRARLWPVASRLGLLDRVTLIPDAEAQRTLPLRCDLLVHPEAPGESRSLLLEAMGAGMCIVARTDPAVTDLLDTRTARLVDSTQPAAWADAISPLLADPALRARLGDSARAYVRAEHRPSAHISGVLDAYEWMASRESIPFSGS